MVDDRLHTTIPGGDKDGLVATVFRSMWVSTALFSWSSSVYILTARHSCHLNLRELGEDVLKTLDTDTHLHSLVGVFGFAF